MHQQCPSIKRRSQGFSLRPNKRKNFPTTIARFQCYGTCSAAAFASTTSCTFGGLFWSLSHIEEQIAVSELFLNLHKSHLISQEDDFDLRSDLPGSRRQSGLNKDFDANPLIGTLDEVFSSGFINGNKGRKIFWLIGRMVRLCISGIHGAAFFC